MLFFLTVFKKAAYLLGFDYVNKFTRQLAKENTKFKYNIVNPMANKRDYELPLDWLIASSMIYKALKTEKTQSPLRAFIDQSNFKIYF